MRNPSDTAGSRREFLQAGCAALAAGLVGCSRAGARGLQTRDVTIGMCADPQYADREASMGRYYRDSVAKLGEFVEHMNAAKPDFVIMLGDLVDKRDAAADERRDLERIENVYAQFKGPRYYVLGNHDVDTFTEEQFIEYTGMEAAHYAFDVGPLHFVVLDANYKADFTPYGGENFVWTDTWVPPAQQRWLAADLKKIRKPTVAFCHQRLDVEREPHGVKNGQRVRRILERSGRVLAVFQGHDHAGDVRRINDISYVTLRGMVEGPGLENNAYALVTISPDGQIALRGFGKQPDRSVL